MAGDFPSLVNMICDPLKCYEGGRVRGRSPRATCDRRRTGLAGTGRYAARRTALRGTSCSADGKAPWGTFTGAEAAIGAGVAAGPQVGGVAAIAGLLAEGWFKYAAASNVEPVANR
jgi:hypothetical protein